MAYLTGEEVRTRILEFVKAHGTSVAAAQALGISQARISQARHWQPGKTFPRALLQAIGVRRVIMFEETFR